MSKFELGEQKFITTLNEKGEKINEQEQLILSQKDAIAHNVLQIENFIKESYFDNNYNEFIKWWDDTVVPVVTELQSMVEKHESL